MSKALVKIKRLQNKPILICDICCSRVGNDRTQCLLDESLFYSFFIIYIEGEIGERGSPKQMAISNWLSVIDSIDLLRRELYNSRKGEWNLQSRAQVISAPLKRSQK